MTVILPTHLLCGNWLEIMRFNEAKFKVQLRIHSNIEIHRIKLDILVVIPIYDQSIPKI